MRWMVLVVGGACVAAAACADAGHVPTGAEAPPRLRASGAITITSPAAGAVTFPAAVHTEAARGLSLSRVPGGADDGRGAVLPLVAVPDGSRGLLARPGEYRRVLTLRDEQGATQHVVALYDARGGPPRVLQHYVGAALVRVMAMTWEHVPGGWAQRRILVREVKNGALALETDARAATMQVASAGASPFALVRAVVLSAVAGTFAPRDAQAQYYFAECYSKYKEYWKATAVLTSAILAIEVAIESGAGAAAMNALYFAYASALAWAVAAEMELYVCVENARAADGAGGTSGSSSGGSSGGSTVPDSDCLEGSYAAHCQTPFTL